MKKAICILLMLILVGCTKIDPAKTQKVIPNQEPIQTGEIINLPTGIFELPFTMIMQDGVTVKGAGKGKTILRFNSSAAESLLWDNGQTVNFKLSDLTLVRSGNNIDVTRAGQDNRYTLHITGPGTTVDLTNVQFSEDSWKLDDYAGLIAIVNESGKVTAVNCTIENLNGTVYKGRGIYQPTGGKAIPVTTWQGYIHNAHKATSIHAGEIHGKGDILTETKVPGAALFSNADGVFRWEGNAKYVGPAQLVFNAGTADVYVKGKFESSAGGVTSHSSTGKVVIEGPLSVKGKKLVNLQNGLIEFK